MNILVIGASRGIGRQTVLLALEQGHNVTALARHPDKIKLRHSKLRLAAADVLDTKALEQAMTGQQAVICALGLPTRQAIGPPFSKPSYVLSEGTANILTAMRAAKVKRLVCVTAIGAGDSARQCTPAARLVLRYGLRWLFKQKDQQEELLKASDRQWTIIRPTALTNGRRQGAKVAAGLPSGLLTQVSRADVAQAMLDLIDKPETYKQALVVSYNARLGDSLRWVAGYLGIG